jgi:hypothetical protein
MVVYGQIPGRLALAYPPRMMNADRSAAYVDLSETKFLDGVDNGTWPPAKDVDGDAPLGQA